MSNQDNTTTEMRYRLAVATANAAIGTSTEAEAIAWAKIAAEDVAAAKQDTRAARLPMQLRPRNECQDSRGLLWCV